MDAHYWQLIAQHLTYSCVLLYLRSGEQHTVYAPFHQKTDIAFTVRAILIKTADDETPT